MFRRFFVIQCESCKNIKFKYNFKVIHSSCAKISMFNTKELIYILMR